MWLRRHRSGPDTTATRRAALVFVAASAWLTAALPAVSQQREEKPYEPQLVTRPPRLLNPDEVERQIAALYPAICWVTGDVLLRFTVSRDGTVDPRSISVVRATNAAFVTPATTVARRLRFTPAALHDGRIVAAWITLPIHFGSRTPLEIDRPLSASGVEPPSSGDFELSEVDEEPVLLNGGEMQRQIARLYPPALRDSGVAGRVVVRFRILEDGTVAPESITVEEATNAAFAVPSATATARMRFSPAKVGGRPVKVWVSIPIYFSTVGPAPRPPAPPPGGVRP